MKTAFALSLFGLLVTSCVNSHPTDEAMIRNFSAHKRDFQELVTMIQSDRGLRRVDDNWTDPSEPTTIGVTPERIADYRRRFASCGVPRGFYSFQSGSNIEFIATAFGLCTGGSGKGYAYLTTPPTETVPSTDTYRTVRRGAYKVYRHIEANWYIAYDYDD